MRAAVPASEHVRGTWGCRRLGQPARRRHGLRGEAVAGVSGCRLGAPRMERAMEQLNRLTRSLRRARTVELPDGRRRGGRAAAASSARPSQPGGGELSWGPLGEATRESGRRLPLSVSEGLFVLVLMAITTTATASPSSHFGRCLAGGACGRAQGAAARCC